MDFDNPGRANLNAALSLLGVLTPESVALSKTILTKQNPPS
jgi:hypothetical protein